MASPPGEAVPTRTSFASAGEELPILGQYGLSDWFLGSSPSTFTSTTSTDIHPICSRDWPQCCLAYTRSMEQTIGFIAGLIFFGVLFTIGPKGIRGWRGTPRPTRSPMGRRGWRP